MSMERNTRDGTGVSRARTARVVYVYGESEVGTNDDHAVAEPRTGICTVSGAIEGLESTWPSSESEAEASAPFSVKELELADDDAVGLGATTMSLAPFMEPAILTRSLCARRSRTVLAGV